jgi:hypothetical protein
MTSKFLLSSLNHSLKELGVTGGGLTDEQKEILENAIVKDVPLSTIDISSYDLINVNGLKNALSHIAVSIGSPFVNTVDFKEVTTDIKNKLVVDKIEASLTETKIDIYDDLDMTNNDLLNCNAVQSSTILNISALSKIEFDLTGVEVASIESTGLNCSTMKMNYLQSIDLTSHIYLSSDLYIPNNLDFLKSGLYAEDDYTFRMGLNSSENLTVKNTSGNELITFEPENIHIKKNMSMNSNRINGCSALTNSGTMEIKSNNFTFKHTNGGSPVETVTDLVYLNSAGMTLNNNIRLMNIVTTPAGERDAINKAYLDSRLSTFTPSTGQRYHAIYEKQVSQNGNSGITLYPTWPTNVMNYGSFSYHSGDQARIRIPINGLYHIVANGNFSSDPNGFRLCEIQTNSGHYTHNNHGSTQISAPTGYEAKMVSSAYVKLSLNDWVTVYMVQNSGSTLSMGGPASRVMSFAIMRVDDY